MGLRGQQEELRRSESLGAGGAGQSCIANAWRICEEEEEEEPLRSRGLREREREREREIYLKRRCWAM